MRNKVKKLIDAFFMKTCSFRLVHDQLTVDTEEDAWEALKIKGFTPRGLIDVGASTGLWTKGILRVYPNAKILMVDPLQENGTDLKSVCEQNAGVRYWLGALGRTNGELEIHAHGPQSSLFASEWSGEKRRVPMKKLDDLLKEFKFDDADGIKIDVQGAELEVLSGATEFLKKCRVIQVEVMYRQIYKQAPLAHEVICFLADHGFRIFDIASLYKREDRALLQSDIFFVSDGSLCLPEGWHL